MYESFLGFSARPFATAPLAKRYFPAAAIEASRQTLARCIERSEGVGLLIGPAGCGKTLLCQVLAEQFRNSFDIALLVSGQLCTRRALLQAILFELGLPYRGMEEGDLRLSLIDHLSPRMQAASPSLAVSTVSTTAEATAGAPNPTAGLLLIVDEAHILPLRLLEELRLITNLARHGQTIVRLVLSGGPQLEERFASPKLQAFNQRVAARCYLEALDRRQTIDYVRHQIQQVGGNPDGVFSVDALEAIYSATDGIPRLVNQLCDHALLLAYAGGVRQLNAAGIEEAWSDLQQLPTPRNADQGAPVKESSGSVVEFGSLDDEPADDLPHAVPFRTQAAEVTPVALSPRDQLRQITAKLAEFEDDFQPAGSIGPEIELTVPAAKNPFAEAFDEEEVLIDRYTTPNSDALANRPLVRSAESRELGAMLSVAVLSSVNSIPQPASFSLHQPETLATSDAESTLSLAPTLPPTSWPGGMPTASHAETAPPAPAEKSTSTAAQSTAAVAAESESDADIIIIEDSPEFTLPAAIKPVVQVRRKEYRQLFAQLRRG